MASSIDKLPLIDVAKRLQDMVERKEYHRVLEILDKIKIPDYSTLVYEDVMEHLYDKVEETGIFPSGGVSGYILTLSNGKKLGQGDKGFWKLIKAENSFMGAWQVFLFENLWTYLPLFQHSNYEKRHYLYTKEDFVKYMTKEGLDKELGITSFDDISVGLGVVEKPSYELVNFDDCYGFRAFYWSRHKGLVNHTEYIFFTDDNIHIMRISGEKTVIKYDCGIMY